MRARRVRALLMGGQACVFYDAAEGQARVLGGGIIAATTTAARPHDALGVNLVEWI